MKPLEPNEYRRKLKKAFRAQRATARQRGIGWNLTYKQWIIFWGASGLLEKRGKGRGKYVMARFGDVGPYTIGNIKIMLGTENSREAHLGKAESWESVEKNRLAQTGRIHSTETKLKMSLAQKGQPKSLEARRAMSIAQRKRFGRI